MREFIIAILLFALSCVCHSENTKKPNNNQQEVVAKNQTSAYSSYPTKFGKLEFVDQAGKRVALASKLLLNGQVIVSMQGVNDKGGFEQSAMVDSFANPIEKDVEKPNRTGQTAVNRMIVAIGPTGNCIRRYIVLDFTGAKPFISKSLSYNPDDDICGHLKKVNWGKQETYIYLAAPNVIYRPFSEIIGPVG